MSRLVELNFEDCDSDGWGEGRYPKKTARGWRLTNLEGLHIDRIQLDTPSLAPPLSVTMRLLSLDSDVMVMVYGDCAIEPRSQREVQLLLDKIHPQELTPVLELLGQKIDSAEVLIDGRLVLSFTDGTVLTALVHPKYESWEVAEQVSLYSQAGGPAVIATMPDNTSQARLRSRASEEDKRNGGNTAAVMGSDSDMSAD